jgi:hypothetical protein
VGVGEDDRWVDKITALRCNQCEDGVRLMVFSLAEL